MKTLRSALVAFAVLFVATAAHAQTTKVQATIPFNFMVGDHQYPAGDYLFSNSGVVLRVTDTETGHTPQMILSEACQKTIRADKSELVFNEMGGYYFLQQIWVAGSSWGRELPTSKSEIRLAQNHDKSNEVIVAAILVK
jgi:hypothetical protein